MIKFKKADNKKLSKNFNSVEFNCSCNHASCVDQAVDPVLVDKLQKVRDACGFALKITSGFRCHKKQQDLRAQGYETATGISTHEKGQAVDVRPIDLSNMDKLGKELEKHFKAVGKARSFYHVDLRDDKVRRWGYANS